MKWTTIRGLLAVFGVLALLTVTGVIDTNRKFEDAPAGSSGEIVSATGSVDAAVTAVGLAGTWENDLLPPIRAKISDTTIAVNVNWTGEEGDLYWYGTWSDPGPNGKIVSNIIGTNGAASNTDQTKVFTYNAGSLLFDMGIGPMSVEIELERV